MSKYADLALLALRLVIGVIFIVHGVAKFGLWSSEIPMTGALPVIMKVLSIVEPLAGIAMILGLLARWTAVILIIDMLGAIYVKMTKFNTGFMGVKTTGWEFDLSLLAIALALFALGAGKYALDQIICKHKKTIEVKVTL